MTFLTDCLLHMLQFIRNQCNPSRSDSSPIVGLEQVHVESVLSILLAAFVGFGIAMVTSTLVIEYNNWKRRTAARAQREREADGSGNNTAQTPEPNPPTADPQHDHVLLQMEGGGLASLWLQSADNRQGQPSQLAR